MTTPPTFFKSKRRSGHIGVALCILLVAVMLTAGCGWLGGRYENDQDILITKLDPDGITLWTKLIDTGKFDHALDIIQTNDGGFVIVGGTTRVACLNSPRNPNPEIPRLTRLSSSGDVIWEKDYGTLIKAIIQNNDSSFSAVSDCGHILKLDSKGNPVNEINPGICRGNTDEWKRIDTFIAEQNGGFLVAGETIAEIDSQGNLSWQLSDDMTISKTYSIAEMDEKQEYLVLAFDKQAVQYAVLHLDRNGRILNKTYIDHSNSPTQKQVIQKTNDGYTILFHDSPNSPFVYFLNGEGEITHNVTLVNTSGTSSDTIVLSDNRSFISLDISGPGNQVKEIKLDSDGSTILEKNAPCSFQGCPRLWGDTIRTSDGGFVILSTIKKQYAC